MKFRKQILPNGDLLIIAGNKARAWLKEITKDSPVNQVWWMLIAEFLGFSYPWLRWADNQDLCDMGALTSSPVLIEITSDGQNLTNSRVWWFPNYQVENEFDTLKNTGRLVMTLAEEY